MCSYRGEETKAWYKGALVDLAEAYSAFREGRYNWQSSRPIRQLKRH
ncbi:MAG: hypothetical protein QXI84_03310 [Thermofilaceae archaeon]